MPAVKGSKQEKLIVVPHRPLQTFLLRCAIVLGLLLTGIGAYVYGFSSGAADNGDARGERDALREMVQSMQQENETLRARLLSLEQTGSVDQQALDNVQQTIVALREKISQLEEDVLFYKQIMSPENAETGLVIGQLDLIATSEPGTIRYKMELKQQGNNENLITGHANINVLGMRDYEEVSIPLHELSASQPEQDIRLQFRYFQNIEGELKLPEGFEPVKVQIIAIAEGTNAKTVQKSFGWLVEN
ncbi:MAG: DUF6776 family protein [Pseudomonadota bacterium]|nr:DUF6776 family protein [Pseudomonadota bacterium]